ncbi:alpha/beta hydrolase family protein [Saccharothrix australiensis]|uniref:Platelet-activating factor acetylhydrolase isoform II n=1 Tax=Saccharothrix australiensis TaxID=2072 RepID=A0A495VWP9_9PSEU|nr:lipase [Saccharothrix australiensis]RKT53003.1 platelet-activating factor acetylhydrolase isoform II [Saccharothrix australiensis]
MSRTLVRLAALGVCAALAGTLTGTAHAAPVRPRLPPPSGAASVGTTDLHLVDAGRPDPWHPERGRELMVTVSYPALPSDAARAPWVSAEVADHTPLFRDLRSLPGLTLDVAGVRRQARVDAPVDRRRGPLPVVLFSPGGGLPREVFATLTDDLAGRGYLVVSVSHTHESGAVRFPDGRVAVPDDQPWVPETARTVLDARIADTRFVLDRITDLAAGRNPDAGGRRLPAGLLRAPDPRRVGMVGHSIGGFTAAEVMLLDPRVKAGVNMDGSFATFDDPYRPGESTTRSVDRPFLLMGTTSAKEDHTHGPDSVDRSWQEFWAAQRGWKRDLALVDGGHLGYSDLQSVLPQLGAALPDDLRVEAIGTVDPARSLRVQRTYLTAFLDAHLRHRPTPLFDVPARAPFRFVP